MSWVLGFTFIPNLDAIKKGQIGIIILLGIVGFLFFTEKKKFLLSILDKNQLYLNLSEIDDEDYDISDKIKSLNKSFYGIKED